MKNYKIKIYVRSRRRALLTIDCNKLVADSVKAQLNNDNKFLTAAHISINKEEIRYVTIVETENKSKTKLD